MSDMVCLVCGGNHDPGDLRSVCSADGMDKQIERMPPRLWNQLSRMVMRKRNAALREQCK